MTFLQKMLTVWRRWRYPGSSAYWERRYATGGNSGAGSSGVLAAYKARIVNQFVESQGIGSVLELGCGDGQQLQLAKYPSYIGLDIAASAVALCQALFADDASKKFIQYHPYAFNPNDFQADMALSMEVLFHLTEEDLYQQYLQHLFGSARHWVVIFAGNKTDSTGGVFPHFKPRQYLCDIPTGWVLREQLPNPHEDISISEFYFFEKTISAETTQ